MVRTRVADDRRVFIDEHRVKGDKIQPANIRIDSEFATVDNLNRVKPLFTTKFAVGNVGRVPAITDDHTNVVVTVNQQVRQLRDRKTIDCHPSHLVFYRDRNRRNSLLLRYMRVRRRSHGDGAIRSAATE